MWDEHIFVTCCEWTCVCIRAFMTVSVRKPVCVTQRVFDFGHVWLSRCLTEYVCTGGCFYNWTCETNFVWVVEYVEMTVCSRRGWQMCAWLSTMSVCATEGVIRCICVTLCICDWVRMPECVCVCLCVYVWACHVTEFMHGWVFLCVSVCVFVRESACDGACVWMIALVTELVCAWVWVRLSMLVTYYMFECGRTGR